MISSPRMITHGERLENCLVDQKNDHVPVALWRHFPLDDQAPESLVRTTLVYQRAFDFDLVKVIPESSYCLGDWGVKDEWLGEVILHLFSDYSIQVINWHDCDTSPSLEDGLHRFPGVVCGALQRQLVDLGTSTQIRSQALDAIQSTSKQSLILGTGCITPITAHYGNLLAVRCSVETDG